MSAAKREAGYERCTRGWCWGDARYPAPGHGHLDSCPHPGPPQPAPQADERSPSEQRIRDVLVEQGLDPAARAAIRDSLGWDWEGGDGVPTVDEALAETYAVIKALVDASFDAGWHNGRQFNTAALRAQQAAEVAEAVQVLAIVKQTADENRHSPMRADRQYAARLDALAARAAREAEQ